MANTINTTKGLTMGYYDGNTVTSLWNYAQRFATSDNSYEAVFGPSTPGGRNRLHAAQSHALARARDGETAARFDRDLVDGECDGQFAHDPSAPGPLSGARPPEVTESGWKDTVRAHSDMVTRFIICFEGYPGRYVWNCHVLEHEDNDMMRPYEVIAG